MYLGFNKTWIKLFKVDRSLFIKKKKKKKLMVPSLESLPQRFFLYLYPSFFFLYPLPWKYWLIILPCSIHYLFLLQLKILTNQTSLKMIWVGGRVYFLYWLIILPCNILYLFFTQLNILTNQTFKLPWKSCEWDVFIFYTSKNTD